MSRNCRLCRYSNGHSDFCLLNPMVAPRALGDNFEDYIDINDTVNDTEDSDVDSMNSRPEDAVFIHEPSLDKLWIKGGNLYDNLKIIGYGAILSIDLVEEEITIKYKAANSFRFVHPKFGSSYEDTMKSMKEQSEYCDSSWAELESCIRYVKICLEQERKVTFNKVLPFPLMSDLYVDRNWIKTKTEENEQEYTFPVTDFLLSDTESV